MLLSQVDEASDEDKEEDDEENAKVDSAVKSTYSATVNCILPEIPLSDGLIASIAEGADISLLVCFSLYFEIIGRVRVQVTDQHRLSLFGWMYPPTVTISCAARKSSNRI